MPDVSRFLDAIRSIETAQLDLIGLISTAEGLSAGGDGELALVLYKFWLMANPTHPLRFGAAFNCGFHLLQKNDLSGARVYFEQAIAANPDYHPARACLASVFEQAGDKEASLREWRGIVDRFAVVSRSNLDTKIQALKNIARIRRNDEIAEQALKDGIEIGPHQDDLVQHWASQRQGRCVWPAVDSVGPLSARDVLLRLAPLSMAIHTDDPLLQLAAAARYSRQMSGGALLTAGHWLPPQDSTRDRIRIAYLSSDFCHHAVGYLMSDVFEHHDRSRFEVTVFNIGERTNDPIQVKIMGKVDAWVDLRGVPDKAAASLVFDRGIDILIDMNGHTNHQRTGLLAMKPAPIIVNWLGYPGTMGSDYHQYIIADDFIVPPEFEQFFSETVVRLPCYQANHKLYQVPEVNLSRPDLGLPATGVVFCCFNGPVKITEAIFSRWMRILQAVPGSVLWLRGSADEPFAPRLREEAARRGVAPERLVFLPFRSNTEYLGCHRHADLFLDTFPYGAHTTGSDALRMGVPVITMVGRGFASRVCGSLSRAAGFPDLTVQTPEEYTRLAIELGTDPGRLAAMKAKLRASLPTCTLFNPALLTTELEKVLTRMWSEYAAGRNPRPQPGFVPL